MSMCMSMKYVRYVFVFLVLSLCTERLVSDISEDGE